MYQKNLETLEFNKIRENLQSFAKTYIGKDMSLSLLPFENKKDILKALKQTTEASILLYRKGNLPLDEVENIIPHLKKLDALVQKRLQEEGKKQQ